MTLTPTVKESIKTALAMTIAYGVGLQAGWDRPYWAGFAIAFISLDTVGQSLNKGALRMTGTLLAAVVALSLIGLFAQQRWLFIFFLSLWFALCTYMNCGQRHQYFWFVAGFVSLIIAADGGPNPEQAFATAMLRIQQTGLGILVYTLVSILLWPHHSRKDFEATVAALAGTQRSLFARSMALLTGAGSVEATQSLRKEEFAGIARLGVLLDAAVSDSEEVRQAQAQWRRYQSSVVTVAEAMQRWRESFAPLQSLPLPRLLPGLEALGAELDARFNAIATLLAGEKTTFSCANMMPAPDQAALGELSHFHRAALLVMQEHLARIDTLTRTMVDTISSIRGASQPVPVVEPVRDPGMRAPAVLDPDRLLSASKMMLVLWLAFLAVIYIPDFPGGIGFVSMCGAVGLILVSSPQIPVSMLFGPVTVGVSIASVLYIFVMPQLSSFTGLGLMMFSTTFAICYCYAKPQQGLSRAMSLAMLVVIISVSNEQSYSFLTVANTALMFSLLFMLLAIVSYIPFSALPERAILRLLRRYFRSARHLLAHAVPVAVSAPPARRDVFHRQEVASLPGKLQTWAAHVSPRLLGAGSSQQLPQLVGALQALTYRLQALQAARGLPQSPVLVEALENPMQQWRHAFVEALQQLSVDPTERSLPLRARLQERLAALETLIADIMDDSAGDSLSNTHIENFYRLIGAYRGSSEALLDFTDMAGTINWQPWYEERFA